MPVIKRYFHCSQDIIADPEVWEMIKEFGDRFILTWLQILIYLERTDNQWKLSGDWLAILSRSVRQSSANLSRQVGQLVAKGWLEVVEVAADGSPLVLKGRNWLKYNNRREHKNKIHAPLLSFPFPSLPLKDKEEEKSSACQVSKKPSRPALLPDDEWLKTIKANPIYAGIDIDIQFRKASAWYPAHGRKLTRRAFIKWLIKEMDNKPIQQPSAPGPYHKKVVL